MDETFVVLEPESPLRLGGLKPRSDYLGTLPYIPGSVLRGSLAGWLIETRRTGQIASIVQRIRFGNLFPSPSKHALSLPFPLTALECKNKAGFQNVPRSATRDKGHGIRDSLLPFLTYRELERRGAVFPVPMALRCRECGGRMERANGFYTQSPEGWDKIRPEMIVQTKVALSRHRRAAQEAMLYRVVALRPKGVFLGRLWADKDDDVQLLKEAVENLGIGALTTRGFGRARLWRLDSSPIPPLDERLRGFNESLKEVWKDLADLAKKVGAAVPEEPDGTYFSVDLLSPAILRDPAGIPSLKLHLNLNGHVLEPVFWATRPAPVGGWSNAWGLPKPTVLGAAMGSVYVFKAEASMDELIPHLEKLEAQGVGDRTDEGLGEVLICHPFHKEVMPV